MSLTARIVIDSSRSIDWAQRLMPVTGIAVATVTLAARWPGLSAAWIGSGCLAAVIIVRHPRHPTRRTPPMTLDVSARSEVDVRIGDVAGTFHLDESTVVWPGFAMLSLARDGGSPVTVRRAVVMDEVNPTDRRTLQRFLVWSLRAGEIGPADRKSAT